MDGIGNILSGQESVKVEHIVTVPTATIISVIAGSLVISLFTAFATDLIGKK